MLQNDLLIRALQRKPLERTPVWLMRQAGRYLPEYQRVRKQAGDFMALCQDAEKACEVTLQPIDRFGLDAAILFSDILTIPDAMGLGLKFVNGEGPVFERPIRSLADIEKLAVPDPEDSLGYVMNAVRLIRQELAGRVPLIGFSGSPWTLASYMVEGSGSKTFSIVRKMRYQQPALMHRLLSILSAAVTEYLKAQVSAGAQVVMVFDTWASLLSPQDYLDFSLPYMARIVEELKHFCPDIPVVLFSKNSGQCLKEIASTGCAGIGLDWTTRLQEARNIVGEQVALQGNIDPAVLYGTPAGIRHEVARVLGEFGHGSGHVFNLGHGIYPDINPDNVKELVNAVKELSPQYHNHSE
ncbi:uroporphyrinogen decarboxylase [Piscirickettsia salmonis]|uniref:Uroporphyrinogen decarboxylase n=2 Tax=Bacteria TaxID=2 RepID=A0A095BRM0_PISSA|nr:uroporphyrinogen decarboxylase [Piscirickettsia salmonis]RNC78244.1 uroporphyrinogen decarboxylase [Piscirickettsiaceae bacterium NZ-RLO2]AKP74788.1 uroporphyrinogen decarboxylase [Piscirickettsia salmonis LF-89 = ATCC VR-1361]ALA26446.1 uroporphyrinogen decarboxylase [Piscirickettsia salmonis]ALB21280.1 uroporphyrinogen decarboxylase HemE [Piscirickettsia salmonis]ALY01528.1 uroporphyrinogen decarboxylase [Piscirickettsia salmonis]